MFSTKFDALPADIKLLFINLLDFKSRCELAKCSKELSILVKKSQPICPHVFRFAQLDDDGYQVELHYFVSKGCGEPNRYKKIACFWITGPDQCLVQQIERRGEKTRDILLSGYQTGDAFTLAKEHVNEAYSRIRDFKNCKLRKYDCDAFISMNSWREELHEFTFLKHFRKPVQIHVLDRQYDEVKKFEAILCGGYFEFKEYPYMSLHPVTYVKFVHWSNLPYKLKLHVASFLDIRTRRKFWKSSKECKKLAMESKQCCPTKMCIGGVENWNTVNLDYGAWNSTFTEFRGNDGCTDIEKITRTVYRPYYRYSNQTHIKQQNTLRNETPEASMHSYLKKCLHGIDDYKEYRTLLKLKYPSNWPVGLFDIPGIDKIMRVKILITDNNKKDVVKFIGLLDLKAHVDCGTVDFDLDDTFFTEPNFQRLKKPKIIISHSTTSDDYFINSNIYELDITSDMISDEGISRKLIRWMNDKDDQLGKFVIRRTKELPYFEECDILRRMRWNKMDGYGKIRKYRLERNDGGYGILVFVDLRKDLRTSVNMVHFESGKYQK